MKPIRLIIFGVFTVLRTATLLAADPLVPDLNLTPGVYRKDLSLYKITHTKWGLDKRFVTERMKEQVFAEYKIPDAQRHITVVKLVKGRKVKETVARYEIDHLISRELGGADDVRNLWPESYYSQPWNAHRKDKLENYLHELLKTKKITLEEARKEIRDDWRRAYRKYFGAP